MAGQWWTDNSSNALRNPVRKAPPNTTQSLIKPTAPGGVPPVQTAATPPTKPNAPVATGTSIPYAGVYLEGQNAAEKAYESAQQQLLANRNTLYHRYGLTNDASVDPYNQYGEYQQLLSSEGSALDQSHNDAIGRGIGTGGLANQGQSALRFQQAGQNLDFQALIDQAGSDYTSGLQQAGQARDQSMYQSERDALAQAIAEMQQNGGFTPVGYGDDPTPPPTTAPIIPPPKKKAAPIKYPKAVMQ